MARITSRSVEGYLLELADGRPARPSLTTSRLCALHGVEVNFGNQNRVIVAVQRLRRRQRNPLVVANDGMKSGYWIVHVPDDLLGTFTLMMRHIRGVNRTRRQLVAAARQLPSGTSQILLEEVLRQAIEQAGLEEG